MTAIAHTLLAAISKIVWHVINHMAFVQNVNLGISGMVPLAHVMKTVRLSFFQSLANMGYCSCWGGALLQLLL